MVDHLIENCNLACSNCQIYFGYLHTVKVKPLPHLAEFVATFHHAVVIIAICPPTKTFYHQSLQCHPNCCHCHRLSLLCSHLNHEGSSSSNCQPLNTDLLVGAQMKNQLFLVPLCCTSWTSLAMSNYQNVLETAQYLTHLKYAVRRQQYLYAVQLYCFSDRIKCEVP